ncbi:hypothetical protein [Reichenbachiella ulvae]|uniref:Uncharacterized protein n=1 Tax=Reichenbachiella ulvae TaxID=2980104 RepID=A0ABT3CZV4_9BACT|nr:hypothetical protein [Reichenbachiella ulvae]MCV9389230.1 hypothetical protein [Reichenbachiella ulvae]
MEKLDPNWLTEHLIDFEYKKYTLLAYLKSVKEKFHHQLLYPQLGELIFHYRNLLRIKENKSIIYDQFPKLPTHVDLENLSINYQKLVDDDELMKELSDIIEFSLPNIDRTIQYGRELYDFVEENLIISDVGLMPIYRHEGYMLLTEEDNRQLKVFRYKVSLIEREKENWTRVDTTFIATEIKSITNTVNKIKLKLIEQVQELPNPATYLFTSKWNFPIEETVLPIAKRWLIKEVGRAA